MKQETVNFICLILLIISLLLAWRKIGKIDNQLNTRISLPIEDIQLLGKTLYFKALDDWGKKNMTPEQIDTFIIKSIKK